MSIWSVSFTGAETEGPRFLVQKTVTIRVTINQTFRLPGRKNKHFEPYMNSNLIQI